MALAASRAGRRVLLVSTDPAHSTSDIFETADRPRNRAAAAEPARPRDRRRLRVAALRDRRSRSRSADLFGHHIVTEANKQIDLAASMPGAEEMALFDRIGALIRGEDSRFDLIVFDTAPTGHTLRLIRMPELMEAWIRALSRSRRAMLGIEQDDKTDPVMISLADRLESLREFRARLLSPRASAFVLVLVAERLPIEETARAIDQLRRRRGDHRRAGRQPGAAGVEPGPVPAVASRSGAGLPRRDRPAIQAARDGARAAVTVGRPRRQDTRTHRANASHGNQCSEH